MYIHLISPHVNPSGHFSPERGKPLPPRRADPPMVSPFLSLRRKRPGREWAGIVLPKAFTATDGQPRPAAARETAARPRWRPGPGPHGRPKPLPRSDPGGATSPRARPGAGDSRAGGFRRAGPGPGQIRRPSQPPPLGVDPPPATG